MEETEQSIPPGPWHGFWTSPEGYLYEAVMNLRPGDGGAVEGEINWTLRKSPRPAEQAKLGMTGVEFVRGTYYGATGTLKVDGYRKTDPNTILGLDKYRLVVSDDSRTLGGITWSADRWSGQILLKR
jgi:hypothetical protein